MKKSNLKKHKSTTTYGELADKKFQRVYERRKQMEETVNDSDADAAAMSCAQQAGGQFVLLPLENCRKKDSGNGAAKKELIMSVFRPLCSPLLSTKTPIDKAVKQFYAVVK